MDYVHPIIEMTLSSEALKKIRAISLESSLYYDMLSTQEANDDPAVMEDRTKFDKVKASYLQRHYTEFQINREAEAAKIVPRAAAKTSKR